MWRQRRMYLVHKGLKILQSLIPVKWDYLAGEGRAIPE